MVPTHRLILVLGMLSAFAPFATDMYLPAFGRMASSFATDNGHIQATLSAFFLGLAVGQAFYGPLIDRFGRRTPLLVGIFLYLVSTVACWLTNDLDLFIALRILQAIGGCAGMIIGRAIVNDLFDEAESARVLSLLLMVMILAPIAAPLLGGFILSVATWRAIFVFMMAFGLLCALLTWAWIPETMSKPRQPISVGAIASTYVALCRKPAFIVPALVGGLGQACMFAFITGSPYVFIGLFKVSEQHFGWLFGLNAAGIIVAAQLNRIGLRRYTAEWLLGIALCVNVMAGLLLVGAATSGSLVTVMVPLWFAVASLGFIGANSAAVAMASCGEHAGSGSALIGVAQFCCAFLISAMVAASQNGTVFPMAIAIAVAGVTATALWFATARLRPNSQGSMHSDAAMRHVR
jgi:DHA1 family bicyclomycin/chloramphenicol resistance-like MFS transporter